jgi:hypothetical protein
MDPATTKPVGTPVDDALAHAQFHARTGVSGIGSTVIRSGYKDSGHFWDCVVTDGRQWHYIRVLGPISGHSLHFRTRTSSRASTDLPRPCLLQTGCARS